MTYDLTHLQSVDDILLFCSWEQDNESVWWTVLNLSLLGSELSLNKSKTSILGLNLDIEDLELFAIHSGCKVNHHGLD